MRVLVTGAASGIGKATSELLLERGHEVVALDIDGEGLEQLETVSYRVDVYDRDRVREVVAKESFEALINCAGYYEQGAVEDVPLDTIEKIFRANVFGLLNVTREALPVLRENGGKVVNVSSIAGRITVPFSGHYCGSKAAVESITDALRMEVSGQGVEVVAVEPGVIETGFNQRARKSLEKYIPDSVYSADYREMIDEGGLKGVEPEVPARKIVRVIETENPEARYQTPSRVKLFVWLEKLTPTFLKDYVKKRI